MLAAAGSFSAQWLTEYLGGRWNGHRGIARCPAHDDHDPSMSITTGKTQNVVVHCFVCPQEVIVAKFQDMGVWPKADRPWNPPPEFTVPLTQSSNGVAEPEWPETPTPLRRDPIIYDYRDEHGAVLFQKIRKYPKDFYQQRPDGTRNLDGVRKVLYRLPELLAAPQAAVVYVCEGEKDADRLAALGLVATTTHDGSHGAWLAEYTAAVSGHPVVVCQDNDPEGVFHTQVVRTALRGHVPSIRVVTFPELPIKGDVTDWLDQGHTLDDLLERALAADEPVDYPLQTLAELVNSTTIDEPMLLDSLLWKGRSHLVFSPPGSGKTLLTLAMLMHVAAGRPFHGRAVQQGTVIFFEEDSPLSVTAEYVLMLADIYDIDLDTLPFLITKIPGLRVIDDEGKERLLSVVRRYDPLPIVVAFDSSERVIPSDRFTTKEFEPFGSAVQLLCNDGITVVVIDHTRKLPTPTKDKEGKQSAPLKVDPIDQLYGGRVKSSLADVMIRITGRIGKGDARLEFVKFRGEEPDTITVSFEPDSGFELRTNKRNVVHTPTEQKVMAWVQNGHSAQLSSATTICEGAKVPLRSGVRAIAALVKRGWLEMVGVTRDAKYRLDTSHPVTFE